MEINDQQPDLWLNRREDVPALFVKEFEDAINSEDLSFVSNTRPATETYASLEWLVPTAVILFIFKGYFDGFLKEAGKDHYNLLKRQTIKLAQRFTDEDSPRATVIGTKGKVAKERKYSLTFSVVHELPSGNSIKLLLAENFSELETEESIVRFLKLITVLEAPNISTEDHIDLSQARVIGGTLLVAYNPITQSLEAIDPIPREK